MKYEWENGETKTNSKDFSLSLSTRGQHQYDKHRKFFLFVTE